MMYRGYDIRKAEYPTKYAPNRTGFDILCGGERRKANADSRETAKWIIDKMISAGKWKEETEGAENNVGNQNKACA